MKEIKKEMIKIFHIDKLGFDMMGYKFKRKGDLSYHHLIVPCRLEGPVLFDNGAILRQNTSHDYLHIIERIDPDIFYAITSELIDENILRKIEYKNLSKIRELLLLFEREHDADTNKKGEYILKTNYIEERITMAEAEEWTR